MLALTSWRKYKLLKKREEKKSAISSFMISKCVALSRRERVLSDEIEVHTADSVAKQRQNPTLINGI